MTLIAALVFVALVFFFLEIFVPGGLLAIIGIGFLVGASVMTFMDYGLMAAIALLIGGVVLAAVLFYMEVRLIAASSWGKHIQLNLRIEGSSLKRQDVSSCIGKTATVVTPLNPSGRILLEGKLLEAKSDSGWIGKGETVEVIDSTVFHIRVKRNTVPQTIN